MTPEAPRSLRTIRWTPADKRDVGMGKALMDAVGDRPVVVEAGKYLPYRMKYIVQTIDIKECFLLTRKGGVRQVFGRRRRSYRPGGVRRAVGQRPERRGKLRLQRAGQRRRGDPAPDFRTGARERRDVVDVERGETRRDPRPEIALREEFTKGERGRREPAGDANAGIRELTDHFAERRVLAADLVDIPHPQTVERNYPRL